MKIGKIELSDWHHHKNGSLYRNSLHTDANIDYVGFFKMQVNFNMTNECWVWQPVFGVGNCAYLRVHYLKMYLGTPLFRVQQESEAMSHMDKFIIKMSGLTAFL